jgi:excinuclease UvrABC nuclease subunit
VTRSGDALAEWTTLFDDELLADGDIGEQQLRAIPPRRGVALLSSADDRAILLLPGADIRARIRNRLRDPESDEGGPVIPDLQGITRRIRWTLATSHFQSDLAYFEIARLVWPREYPQMVAWQAPLFVQVDWSEEYPSFRRTRDVVGGGGQLVGPMPTVKDAERFIQGLEDAFDLCRDPRHLASAPNGQRCAYAQMGRCLCPCDGSIPAREYRQVVERAARFAAGQRGPMHEELHAAMKAASAELEFEKASALKRRIERLAELEGPAFREVAPIEQFEFILVQPTGRISEARAYFFRGGRVFAGTTLQYPLVEEQLTGALATMERFHPASLPPEPTRVTAMRMGLVARQLFCRPERRGVMLRWREGVTSAELVEAIEEAAEDLGLRERAAPAAKKSPPGANSNGGSGDEEQAPRPRSTDTIDGG